MKHLELKQQIKFCEKYGIAPNELLLFEIILLSQEDDCMDIVKDYFMLRACSKGSVRDMLIKLQDCGLIKKSFKVPEIGQSIDPNDIPLNMNVIKDYRKSSFELGKELFEIYPQFCIINGCNVGIRSVSKKFDSLEDFYKFYGKSIGWNIEKHNYIIDLVNWGKENNCINNTLCNFVIDKKWEELESLKDGSLGNINYNAVKLL